MVVAGVVKTSTAPVRAGRADTNPLVATPLARADAAAGRPTTTNLRHESAPLDAVNLVLLPYIDGASSRLKLKKELLKAIAAKRINMTDNATGTPLAGDALDKAAAEHVELAIERRAAAVLLMPQRPLAQ